VTERYIFSGEVDKIFYEKLNDLHEKYVIYLLLNGVAKDGSGLESVKMTKSPDASTEHCKLVIEGFIQHKPEILVRYIEDKQVNIECAFIKFKYKNGLDYTFMMQNVMNWPCLGIHSCQIWYLGETPIKVIKEHWSE